MIKVDFEDISIDLESDPLLFSPERADRGTLAMLSEIQLLQDQKVLDLGCGYGLVGIYAAKICGPENVWMVDKVNRAIELSRVNAKLNNCDQINLLQADGPEILLELGHKNSFKWILCNPPYHEDFSVAKRFIETSKKLLINEGQLVLVVKRLEWYKNKMHSVFGGVRIINSDGYYVLISEKRTKNINTDIENKKKTTRKHLKKLGSKKNTHRSKS